MLKRNLSARESAMKRSLGLVVLVCGLVVVPAAPVSAAASPCLIPHPGTYSCAGTVTFSSYALSNAFRPMQATAGTSVQSSIYVSFVNPIRNLRVWTNDPDLADNAILVHTLGSAWLLAALV